MKFINKSILSIISVAMLLLLFSCGQEHIEGDGHDHGNETAQHSEDDGHGHGEEHEEGEIHLTKEQIETMNIQFGDLSQIKVNDYVSTTGTLGLPPISFSSVSAVAEGFIKKSHRLVEGDYVRKGQQLAELENPDFIQRQQEYLETTAELTYLHQELERQQKLVDAEAGIEKKVQKLQSEVAMKTATMKGIAKQLSYWGIKVSSLTPDNIVDHIDIFSPMSGYITSLNMHNGRYVTPQEELIEIVSDDHIHLELDVFEKDISMVEKGQRISYSIPALGNTAYGAEVHIIGKVFNVENKTVRIHGHLEKERPKFIKDLFVEAKIWLTDQTVQALPEAAIIKDGASSYIYVAANESDEDELKFEKIMVIPGVTDKGFTAVKLINSIPDGMKIVTDGAYYVYAQSKAGELEHEH